jgi:hypothetical protein
MRRPAAALDTPSRDKVVSMTKRGIIQSVRMTGLLLALFAITLKAIVPAGYMLSPSSTHNLVTLCTSNGGQLLLDLGSASDDSSEKHAPHNNANDSQRCPFSLAGAPTIAPPLVSVPVRQSYFAPVLASRVTVSNYTVSSPPLPARGPPHQA